MFACGLWLRRMYIAFTFFACRCLVATRATSCSTCSGVRWMRCVHRGLSNCCLLVLMVHVTWLAGCVELCFEGLLLLKRTKVIAFFVSGVVPINLTWSSNGLSPNSVEMNSIWVWLLWLDTFEDSRTWSARWEASAFKLLQYVGCLWERFFHGSSNIGPVWAYIWTRRARPPSLLCSGGLPCCRLL